MIRIENLTECIEHIDETVDCLTDEDVEFLVSLLALKEDKLRYQAFQLLQKRSERYQDVYPYWNVFAGKLDSDNSYQRNIGVALIAENVRWDSENRFEEIADKYLSLCNDEKPITSRLTIQSITKWIGLRPEYRKHVKKTLYQIDLSHQRETMRKLILTDIIGVLVEIQKTEREDDITDYLVNAVTGGILDKKYVKQLEKLI